MTSPIDFVAQDDHVAGRSRQAGFHLHRPPSRTTRRHVRARRAQSSGSRIRSQIDEHPTDTRSIVARLPASTAHHRQPWRLKLRTSTHLHRLPSRLRRPATHSSATRKTASGSSLRPTRPPIKLLGARPRSDLFRDRSLGAIGKRVLITGASSGHRPGARVKVGEAGGEVLLVSRTREKLEEVASRSRTRAAPRTCIRPTSPTSRTCDRLAAEVLDEHGGVDVLVNNAGRSIRRSVRAPTTASTTTSARCS